LGPAPPTSIPPYVRPPSPAPASGAELQSPPGSVQPPPVAAIGPAAPSPSLSLRWSGPAQVRVGDEFSAELVIEPRDPLQAVPVVIAFDPQVFRVEHVEDGGALSAAGSPASTTHRVDAANGQVFASLVRTSPSTDARAGTLLTLRVRALKPSPGSSLSILSAQATLPDGRPATATLPAPFTLTVAP
jgi:general secretion pathway protein D